jgi:hypothetical protein
MSGKSILRLGLMAVACALAAGVPAHAWDCSGGTLIVAAADDSTNPGTGCGSNYTATQTSNNTRQCLQESLSSGVSHLTHTWRFDSVPAGQLFLIYEGFRLNNSDGENFRFSGTTTAGGFISGAYIDMAREEPGGTMYDLSVTTTSAGSVYLTIKDTAAGTNLDTVELDYLAICSMSLE